MKCEPVAYSIDNLAHDKVSFWEGVRNYQARNFLRDDMKKGDLAFFYHSNATPSGIVGLMEIVKEGYPDQTALNPKSQYYDPKASLDKPIWYGVDVQFIQKYSQIVTLNDLREIPGLEEMCVLRKGSRLSIQPVTEKEFNTIINSLK